MASRRISVEIVGSSEQLERAFGRSAASAKIFGGEISKASRGVLAGSGAFRGLGRSIAFASGGFLAFASAGEALRKSIDAAQQAAVAQRQLSTQIAASGKSFATFRTQIEGANERLSLLSGFNSTELEQSLTTIFRSTGNVTKALRDNATAANLARARHIGLAQAAFIIAKVEAGNTTLLRRQAFQIAKNASAEQALAFVRVKVAGQARAGTTEQERFAAVLHNTEVIVGTALLPTLNKYLASGSKWLEQMNESGRLQHDVQKTTKDISTAFDDLRSVVRGVDNVTGGFKNTLELLLALKVGSTFAGWGGTLGLFTKRTIAAEGAAAGLRAELAGLAAINPIVIPITFAFFADKFGHGDPLGFGNIKSPTDLVGILTGRKGFLYDLFAGKAKRTVIDLPVTVKPKADVGFRSDAITAALAKAVAGAQTATTRKRLTAAQRNTFFDNDISRLLDRSQDGGLKDQIRKLQAISKLISQRIAATKDVTRKLHLEDELVAVGRTIRSDRQQLAQQIADRLKADKAAALAATSAREFKILGLDATGNALVPGKPALKKQLGRIADAVKGTFLDTSKTRHELAAFRKVLSESLVPQDVRQKMQQLLAGLDQDLQNHARKNQTAFRHISTNAIIAQLGVDLSPLQRRHAREVLAQIGAGGTAPGRHSQAFSGAGNAPVNITVPVQLDGKTVAVVTHKHLSRRRTASRRG